MKIIEIRKDEYYAIELNNGSRIGRIIYDDLGDGPKWYPSFINDVIPHLQ